MARLDLAQRHLEVLQKFLAQYVPDQDVWAYGSRIKGTAHEGSDLDIVLRSSDLNTASSGLSALRNALQQSNLPMVVDVHDWAHLPAAFQSEIEQNYVVLQTAHNTTRGTS